MLRKWPQFWYVVLVILHIFPVFHALKFSYINVLGNVFVMEIYVGNLPKKSDANELCLLFEKSIRPKGLAALLPNVLPKSRAEKRRSVSLPRYEVVEVAGENPARYGHVVLYPESLARQVITDLRGATLRGEPVYVREFYHRAYINDRRLLGWRNRHWDTVERRTGERRQGLAVGASGL